MSRGLTRRQSATVLPSAQWAIAARFLKEAANPPLTPAAQAAFRMRWSPWLWDRAPGPIGPRGSEPAA